jgi:hypothetical protein
MTQDKIQMDNVRTELADPRLPLERDDIDTLELEVSIYQTSASEATAMVNDFAIRSEIIMKANFE